MPTGQAGRACLLNSACLVASGASPRHSASACSSKRAGGFITRIALDECLVPERYRTRAPIGSALKALSAMPSLGKRISPVQLRVRDPFRNRASAQAGFISQLRRGQHSGIATISPPCSSLRMTFVKSSCRSITGWRLQSFARVVQQKRHDVEGVASAGASPAASTILACKH